MMDVDFWGVVNGTKAFLPHLIASGDGHVINMSSVFGLFSVPGQAAYNSAKFAVRGFTEALRQEMMLAGHPVKVTSVHPGGIKTAIARNSTAAEGVDTNDADASLRQGWRAPARRRAARIILKAVERTRPGCWSAPDAKVSRRRRAVDGFGLSAAVRRLTALPAPVALAAPTP